MSRARSARLALLSGPASGRPPDDPSNAVGAAARLLETKLYVPRSRADLVARPALIERIRQGVARALTLVVAPAGFGKTTLLTTWLAGAPGGEHGIGSIAWVSLDATENEPALFWAYVVRALQTVLPTVGTQALMQLQSPPPPIESVLTAVINDVDAQDEDCVLVLDDYHVIETPAIHAAMAFLLDHLPPRMRVVLATRVEPPLPLARLRARGELTELRAADLRFTLDEAAVYLNRVMALDLSASDTATLGRRTEGWIAGLKLAALSMQGRQDVRGFVDAFTGDHRYVADYLVDEVLNAEPAPVRRFLSGTAILDRLSAPLCDAVTGEGGSQALLESLERRGLFVVALDDRREWYRYHHLFAEVLQAHARREDPERARACHRRASVWYERAGASADAVRHAFAAEDLERAADLLEATWPEKDRSFESAAWLARVKSLPDAAVRARPVLGMGYAWALLNGGELEAAEARLRDVERALGEPDGVPNARLATLPSELAAARVYLAQARGDVPGSVEHARRALALVPDGDIMGRATGTALVALALWGRGELEAAHATFSDALALMRDGGNALSVIRGTFVLGDIRATQGRLREAASVYERGLRLAAAHAAAHVGPTAPETDELHLGLSELHREWGDLDAAVARLESITTSPERAAHAGNRQRWCTAMARVREARGDLAGALDLLDEAERHDLRNPLPRVRPIPAMKARLWIAQGRLAEANDWVRERGLTIDDDLEYALAYAREFEHVTLARVLIARHETHGDERALQDAVRLLERLTDAAERGGRVGCVIETLALASLARRAQGDVRGALALLQRALELAAPEGHLRVFVDEGRRMRDLLRLATARGVADTYTPRVLSAFDAPAPAVAAPPITAPVGGLAQALTTRELEILRLIRAGLRNQEIAEQLSISPATVKRHVANAYGKLGASHRTEALARARELRVL